MARLQGIWSTCVLVLINGAALGATLDTNFTETLYGNAGVQVTGIVWAPDGSDRLFVSRKMGRIAVIKNGSLLATPFAIVGPLNTTSECGLIGICFDPNFIVNKYVYVFATVSTFEQQIIRYTAVGDVGTNKTIVMDFLPTRGAIHDGGAVGVGPDGKLYWGIGDNGEGRGVDGDLLLLASKIGRANLDGSVPLDNPFRDGPGGNNDYIWARGFRNPFTFTFQPSTGTLWVNSVGDLYEQVFEVHAGDHAGWNDYENNQPAGYITPKIKYRTNGKDVRNVVAAVRSGDATTFTTDVVHGFRQGEKITTSGVTDSSFNGAFYVASTPTGTNFTVAQAGPDASSSAGTATTEGMGGALTGGCFCDSSGVPAAYRGNYFFGDINSNRVMRAVLDVSNQVTSVDYFSQGITGYIDMAVGPDGALYYGAYAGNVYRVAYNFVDQQLIVTPMNLRAVEGGIAALTVRLATAPLTNIEVSVTRTAGDGDISVATGAALTFTPTNWAVPQVVQVQAALDGDSIDDIATLTVTANELTGEAVTVRVLDLPPKAFSLGPITREAGSNVCVAQIRLNGEAGRTYVLEANSNVLATWAPLSTNQLLSNSATITDFEATNLPSRFYRARFVP